MPETEDFPFNCIRGITDKQFVATDGTVASHMFFPDSRNPRDDGWVEESINWEDNEGVMAFTFGQQKDGKPQFREGITVIIRSEIDIFANLFKVTDTLKYERQVLPENPYHGNLLLHRDVPKPTRKKLAAGLALLCSKIIPPP